MAARVYIGGGDPVAPPNGRQAPVARWVGDRSLFFARDLVANLKKKNTFRSCRPMGGRPRDIFEIVQNGHIFLKFLFLKNIKKKKPPWRAIAALDLRPVRPNLTYADPWLPLH